MTNVLVISETFGPTVQGEGPWQGFPAMFIRLGLCNLACGAGPGATWACDTPYTWDFTGKLGRAYSRHAELRHVHVEDLVSEAAAWKPRLVVITGGEPMVQWKQLHVLTDALQMQGKVVQVETNGTLLPEHKAGLRWVVSPKLANSGHDTENDVDWLRWRLFHAAFKFVCATADDLEVVRQLTDRHGIEPPEVWILPAGDSIPAIQTSLSELWGPVTAHGFRLSGRLHVSAGFGGKRGR